MSPSEAPESEEPNCSMASFSSAISSALTDSGDAARGLVDVGDLGVEPVADGEALRALLGAVARQVGLADEGGHRRVVVAELDLDAARGDLGHRDGDGLALAVGCRSAIGSPASCLMPSEMRSFSTSTSSTLALTMSPFL